jgi:monovalent cation:H+ antiporter-2, CPA2 family
MIGPMEGTPVTGGLGLTLLLALAAALVLGTLAQRLRLEPLIGFIAAGLVVGPFTPGFVADQSQIFDLANIGIALLMFSIGLRFSLRSIASGGTKLLGGAVLQVLITMGVGTAVGVLAARPWLEALFIGAIVSNSSSVVIVKVAGEEVVQGTTHGRVSLIWSTVQDLMTVALVVLLASLAGATGEEVLVDDPFLAVTGSTLLAVGFIVAVVLGGSRVFPFVLGQLARIGSREIFVIGVAVLAIGSSFAATLVGVSVALGAFVTGIALAESDLTDSVLGEIVPLRELFSAFFFVSIGLLIDPAAIVAGFPMLLVVVALVVVVKGLITAGIARGIGHAPATSLRVGALLAQNGEFSFVLAVVGLQAGALSGGTFSVLMGAVVATIVLLEPLLRGVDLLAERLPAGRGDGAEPADVAAGWNLRRHAVVLGYGRVGRTVVRALTRRSFPYVAIDGDYETVLRARREGDVQVLFGEAGSPTMLDAAGIERATILVVAIPDALATRQAISYAMRRNARIDVTARAPSEAEAQQLRELGVRTVVVAEREVANELMRHTLHRFGVTDREVAAMLESRRRT